MASPTVLDPRARDLSGMTFGLLTALRPVGSTKVYITWECRCACGGSITTTSRNLKSGRTTHCGCEYQQRGISTGHERRTWVDMRNRCYNPRNKRYPLYGGRGITVCQRWQDAFDNFMADMGPCPLGYSLDRIDNDGHYAPENCRWASATVQGRNSRHNRRITFNGQTKCLIEWVEATGINADAIYGRLALGWSVERALTTPVRQMKR